MTMPKYVINLHTRILNFYNIDVILYYKNCLQVVLDSKLSSDITIVLAMFRKQEAVAKDAATDIIFDGRGNIVFANEKHCQSIQ